MSNSVLDLMANPGIEREPLKREIMSKPILKLMMSVALSFPLISIGACQSVPFMVHASQSGRMAFRVMWPQRQFQVQVIPEATERLEIEIQGEKLPRPFRRVLRRSASRPEVQESLTLPEGSKTVLVKAYDTGQTLLAEARAEVMIVANETQQLEIELQEVERPCEPLNPEEPISPQRPGLRVQQLEQDPLPPADMLEPEPRPAEEQNQGRKVLPTERELEAESEPLPPRGGLDTELGEEDRPLPPRDRDLDPNGEPLSPRDRAELEPELPPRTGTLGPDAAAPTRPDALRDSVEVETENRVPAELPCPGDDSIPGNRLVSPSEGPLDRDGNPLPPRDGAIDRDGNPLPPRDGALDRDGNPLPPRDGALDPDGNRLPPRDGALDPDSNRLPPRDGALDPDGNPLPPRDGALDPDGNRLPPRDGVLDPDGNRLPPRDGVLDPDGNPPPPRDGLLPLDDKQEDSEDENIPPGQEDSEADTNNPLPPSQGDGEPEPPLPDPPLPPEGLPPGGGLP